MMHLSQWCCGVLGLLVFYRIIFTLCLSMLYKLSWWVAQHGEISIFSDASKSSSLLLIVGRGIQTGRQRQREKENGGGEIVRNGGRKREEVRGTFLLVTRGCQVVLALVLQGVSLPRHDLVKGPGEGRKEERKKKRES